ncbi:uncharacterized protein [Haliotis asinina]|uniref:uncharacterized protein n=1 Tax=Haliotis asinina TaxID=109174 RepID=UPI0035319326
MRIKLQNIFIRCICVTLQKRKFVFELKYGHIIAKKVSGGHLSDIVVNVTCLDNRSRYFTKSLPIFTRPEQKPRVHISIIVYTNPSISLKGNFEALVARRGATLQEVMVYEALRLKSFHGVDTANVSTIRLAAAGFYATEQSGEIRCFSCGVRQRIGPQATRRHQTDCRHINGLPCGNQTFADCPLASEFNIIRNLPRYPTTDNDLHQPRINQANHAVRMPDHPTEANPTALGVRLRESHVHQAPQRPPGEVPRREGPPGSVGSRELGEDQDRLLRDIKGDDFPVGDRSGASAPLQVEQQRSIMGAGRNIYSGHGLERHRFMASSLCRICRYNPDSIHFHLCGHVVARTLCPPSERCPLCRQHFS